MGGARSRPQGAYRREPAPDSLCLRSSYLGVYLGSASWPVGFVVVVRRGGARAGSLRPLGGAALSARGRTCALPPPPAAAASRWWRRSPRGRLRHWWRNGGTRNRRRSRRVERVLGAICPAGGRPGPGAAAAAAGAPPATRPRVDRRRPVRVHVPASRALPRPSPLFGPIRARACGTRGMPPDGLIRDDDDDDGG